MLRVVGTDEFAEARHLEISSMREQKSSLMKGIFRSFKAAVKVWYPMPCRTETP